MKFGVLQAPAAYGPGLLGLMGKVNPAQIKGLRVVQLFRPILHH